MNFITILLIALSSLFSGGAISSLFCIVFGKILKRKYLRARFSMVFVFFALAIAFFTACFFAYDGFLECFPLKIFDILFFSTVFILGVVITVFWKIALPAFLLVFIGFSSFFGFSLYHIFGITDDIHQVVVTPEEVFIDDEKFEAKVEGNNIVEIRAFVLNERLLLPLPRVWYKIVVSGDETDILSSPFIKKIISDQHSVPVTFPTFSVLPAVFTVKCTRTFDTVRCNVEKSI